MLLHYDSKMHRNIEYFQSTFTIIVFYFYFNA